MIKLECYQCKKEFHRYQSSIKDNNRNFCSKNCLNQFLATYLKQNPPRKKRKINIGQTISYLTLININKVEGNRKHWLCECICGNLVTRREDYLYKCIDKNKNTSCGCKSASKKTGKNNPKWSGCGQISGLYFAMTKCRANKKGIEFNITIEDMWNLFQKQDGKCAISGVQLELSESKRTGQIMTASIDRIDSSKGYTLNNIQWIHKDINKMKNVTEQSKFINWCKIIASYNISLQYTLSGA